MNLSKYTGLSNEQVVEMLPDSPLLIEANKYKGYVNVANSYSLIDNISETYQSELREFLLYNRNSPDQENNALNLVYVIQSILDKYIYIAQVLGVSLVAARKIYYEEVLSRTNILDVPILGFSDFVIQECLHRDVTEILTYFTKKDSFTGSSTSKTTISDLLGGLLYGIQKKISGTVNETASEATDYALRDNLKLIFIIVIISGLIIYAING